MWSEQNEVRLAATWRVCCVTMWFVWGISQLAEVVEIDRVTSRMVNEDENLSKSWLKKAVDEERERRRQMNMKYWKQLIRSRSVEYWRNEDNVYRWGLLCSVVLWGVDRQHQLLTVVRGRDWPMMLLWGRRSWREERERHRWNPRGTYEEKGKSLIERTGMEDEMDDRSDIWELMKANKSWKKKDKTNKHEQKQHQKGNKSKVKKKQNQSQKINENN